MKRMKLSCLVLAAAAAALAPKAASAASVQYSDSIANTTTNWGVSPLVNLNLTQFDPSLGVLNSISIKLTGSISGDAKFESFDHAASTVTTNLNGTITLTRPDASTLAVVLPVASTSDNVTAYDNNFDWGGLSGRTYTGLFDTKTSTVNLSSGTDKALFTGLGTIQLPVSAVGVSFASGNGNIISQFATSAAANVVVTYDYTPTSVPVPAAAPAGMALLGVLGFRRWKNAKAQ